MIGDFPSLGAADRGVPRDFGGTLHAYGDRKRHLPKLPRTAGSQIAMLTFQQAALGDQPRWRNWVTNYGPRLPDESLPLWSPAGIPSQSTGLMSPWTISIALDMSVTWVLRVSITPSGRDRDGLEAVAPQQGAAPQFESLCTYSGPADI